MDDAEISGQQASRIFHIALEYAENARLLSPFRPRPPVSVLLCIQGKN